MMKRLILSIIALFLFATDVSAANYYVRSGAGGAGTGADWANAYTTMTAAVAAKAAGDIFYVSDDHAESTAGAVTITVVSSATVESFVYCVNHLGSVPPVSADLCTTASVATTGGNALAFNGTRVYVEGLILSCGTSGSPALTFANTNTSQVRAKNIKFVLGSASGQNLSVSGTNGKAVCENCTVQFGATNSAINTVNGTFIWKNTPSAIVGATLPSVLLNGNGVAYLQGVDLSALGSGKTVFNASQSYTTAIDCKLGASVTRSATAQIQSQVDIIRCDSGATNYINERYQQGGSHVNETTIIRTGGATDGTTPESWKFVTTGNSNWVQPFESQPITIWNNSTSAITTLTLYGTTTGGGVPNNDDIWVEVEYLGSGLTPQGSFKTTTKADNLAASVTTNNSSDASTWGGGGAGNGFKIVMPSFTPGMVGPMNITIKAAKASSTYYMDPRPSINGVTVSKSFILSPGVYANELASGGSSIIGE